MVAMLRSAMLVSDFLHPDSVLSVQNLAYPDFASPVFSVAKMESLLFLGGKMAKMEEISRNCISFDLVTAVMKVGVS